MLKKIIGIGVLVIMIFSLSACRDNTNYGDTDLSRGFYTNQGQGDGQIGYQLGFKSEAMTFNVDDVNFMLYYGIYCFDNYVNRPSPSIVTQYKLVVVVANDCSVFDNSSRYDELIILKEYENFSSDLLEYTKTKVNKKTYRIDYNFSTQVTVPSEIFSDESGSFCIGCYQWYKNADQNNGRYFEIYYKLYDGLITLSFKEF